MTTAESRRHDLYNGLTEYLGEDRADTLMTYLPSQESTNLATRADLDALENRLVGRLDVMSQRLETVSHVIETVSQRIDTMGQRIDRMVLALVAGLVAIIATLVAQSLI